MKSCSDWVWNLNKEFIAEKQNEQISSEGEEKDGSEDGQIGETSKKEGSDQNEGNLQEPKQGNASALESNSAGVHPDSQVKPLKGIRLKDALTSKGSKQKQEDDKQNEEQKEESGSISQKDNAKNESEKQKEDDVEDSEINKETADKFSTIKTSFDDDDEVNLMWDEDSNWDDENKETKSDKYELLDTLFSFFLNEKQDDSKEEYQHNPVLSGYVQKVVLGLLNYKQKEIMKYIYHRLEEQGGSGSFLEKMIDHIYDQSIWDIIIKVLNISNNSTLTTNNSINNDSGEIFKSPRGFGKEESWNISNDYEKSRNEIIIKLVNKLIRSQNVEEYWNASTILCEMAKFSQLFGYLSCQDVMDKISIGLENDDAEGIKHTLKLFNTILREYSKDGTNKCVNISAPLDDEDYSEQDNDTLGLKLDSNDNCSKDKNASRDKSGDQSGSNLSKSIIAKESEREKQFIGSICALLPLVLQLITDEVDAQFIETSYGEPSKVFGGVKLEAVEMIRVIASKFFVQIKDELIKANVLKTVLDLFEKYPNNSMLHSKIEDIVKSSLKSDSTEIIEELMDNTQLVKYILELNSPVKRVMTFAATQNSANRGYHAYILSIANELVRVSRDNSQVRDTLESIPEWTQFEEGELKQSNERLETELGGRDPRAKIETPFDDNDFLGRFKGFKPVPFESIKNRRKNLIPKQDEDIEQETEEEEEEDEDRLDFDEINKYFTSNDDKEIEIDMDNEDIFERADEDSRDLKPSHMARGRYDMKDTIELDDDDDVPTKGLEWTIDPVNREDDDEKVIDDSIKDVAIEFIEGQKSRRKHRKNKECILEGSKKEFFFENHTLKELQVNIEEPKPIPEATAKADEDKEFYDTNYWSDPYKSHFKIEDLLLE